MTAWRITSSRHLEHAFSGAGAEEFGGRFNSRGRRIMYCSESISLAMLELLVQANKRERLSTHWCISASFDASLIEFVEADSLPSEWDARPHGQASQRFGDRWIDEVRSVVLSVPSIVNPYERNYLINPAHPRFDEIEMGEPVPAPFDPRLIEGR